MTKQRLQIIIGLLSLFALLTYTWVHTGGLLARYVTPSFVGYLAAGGIELAVVGLSYRIGQLRKAKQSPVWFYFVLVAVVVVSALANVAEGFHVLTGQHLTLDTAGQLDVIQVVIGLSATGLISLIVLALAEIIGTDVTQYAKHAQSEQRKITPRPVADKPVPAIKMSKVDKRRQEVADLISEGMTVDDIAGQMGVSVRTIQRDKESLNGQFIRL